MKTPVSNEDDDNEEIAREEPEAAAAEDEEEPVDNRDKFQKEFDKLMSIYEYDKAEEPDNFVILDIKQKIIQFFEENP